MTYNFVENTANDKIQPLQAIIDDDGSIKFTAPNLGSSNFDGFIPVNTASAYVNNVNAGDYFSPSGSSTFYQVVSVEREDPSLTQTGSVYSGYQDIYYVDDNGELTSASFSSSAAVVYLKNEEWESEERFLGNNGWIITSGGNAIFTNVAVRGRIEAKEGYIGGTDAGWEITDSLFSNASVGFYAPSATTGQVAIFAGAPFASRASAAFRVGYDGSMVASSANITGALTATTMNVGGSAGITYNGSNVTIGTGVTILGTTTTDSLLVGASPNLLRISASPNGVVGEDGIFISSANYWYSTGKFSLGGTQGITFNSGSVVIGTDVYVNAGVTVNALTVGTAPNILKISASPAGSPGNDGIYINNDNYWFSNGYFGVGSSVNSVVWNGTFLTVTGSIAATSITASVGNVGGFTLSKNQLSASQVILSSSGGLRLGATNQFSVDQSGNLIATSASITGNITANSGTFTGSISAQHITASTGSIAGFALANNQMSTASVIVSSSGGFRLGNPEVFSVDQFGNLVASTASITGRINATSGSFSGDITASAGRFVGALSVSSSGAIYAGTNVDSGQRTVLNASGLFGYHSSGIEAFALPVSGSPRLGTFTIIPTGIVSQSASYANMIYGNVDASGSVTDGIVIRGSRSSGASAAIYTVQNGVETSYAAGNGFYVDENARFKLKGATGSLAFDGTDLYVSGNINATSGAFTGSVSAQFITASIGRVGGFVLSASSLTASPASGSVVGLTTGASAIFVGATSLTGAGAPFWVSSTGSIFASNATITGDITATNITSSVGRVGGFLLSASSLTASINPTTAVGITTGASAIFAGATSRTGAGAPFLVGADGSLFATNATITGNITAESGTFTGSISAQNITASIGNVGGFRLSATSLTASSTPTTAVGMTGGASAFFAGATSRTGGGAKFWVSDAGAAFSESLTVTTGGNILMQADTSNPSNIIFTGANGTTRITEIKFSPAGGTSNVSGSLAISPLTDGVNVGVSIFNKGTGVISIGKSGATGGLVFDGGAASFAGNVSAAQLEGSTTSGFRALSATRATTTAADEIAIFRSSIGGANTTKFSFQANGKLRAEGDGSFGGDFAVTGATTLNATTFNSGATFNANALFNSDLRITGTTAYTALQSAVTSTNRTITFPDITGTVALLGGTQTFTGGKTFASTLTVTVGGIEIDSGGIDIVGTSTWAGSTFVLTPTDAEVGWLIDENGGDPVLKSNSAGNSYGKLGISTSRIYYSYLNNVNYLSLVNGSDIRLKNSIEEKSLGLDFINKLRPVRFKLNDGGKRVLDENENVVEESIPGTRWHYGLIAQEVKSVLDELQIDASLWGMENKDDLNSTQHLSYIEFVGPLIKAIQEQQKQIQELSDKIDALENKNI